MRQERTTFEQVWQGYIQQVSQLLEKQVSERTEALATFDSTEDAWKSQLEEATAELGRQSSQTEFRECIDLEEDEDAEMDRKEALVADAVEGGGQDPGQEASGQGAGRGQCAPTPAGDQVLQGRGARLDAQRGLSDATQRCVQGAGGAAKGATSSAYNLTY